MEVLIDPANTSQNRFIAAVDARASDLRAFERDRRTLGWKITGFGASLLGLPFACATLVLCIIDAGAFLTLGGWTAATVQNLVDLYNSSQTNARRAAFYNCRMQGNAYTACLTVAGITDEELGGDYE